MDDNYTDIRKISERIGEEKGALIDVRGFDEYAACHATLAKCIPLSDIERRCGEIPSDRPIFVICQSGARSKMASDRLRALGFNQVTDIRGGMDAWSGAGLPTTKQAGVFPLERQVRGVAGMLVFAFTLGGIAGPHWLLVGPLFVGFMLFLSSVTGICPMLSLLKLMPWNRAPTVNAGCSRGV